MNVLRLLHRAALAAYPRRFRREFGDDVERTVLARVADARARSRGHALALAVFCLFDTLVSGLAERVRGAAIRWAWPRHHAGLTASVRTHMTWESVMSDVRLAVRQSRRAPVFAGITIACLALGIGANSAIFGVVHAVLLRPLPYAQPAGLVAVWSDNTKAGEPNNSVSPANFEAVRGLRTFAGVEAMYSFLVGSQIYIGAEPEIVQTAVMTPGMFTLLGRDAAMGRPFQQGDPDNSVVLSYEFWHRRFAGDPQIVGKTVRVAGVAGPMVILGVMPDGFVFPYRSMLGPSGFSRALQPDAWVMLTRTREVRLVDASGQPNRTIHFLSVVARPAPGATTAQATKELASVAGERAAAFPDTNTGWGFTARSLHEQAVGGLRPALVILLAGVGVVLLVTCINVANVVLARAHGRRRDLAVRSALGASRARLARQMFVESLMLSAIGGAAGFGLTAIGLKAILALAPSSLPRVAEATPSLIVAAFAALISIVTGLAVGAIPALQAGRSRAEDALRDGQRATASRAARRVRAGLIVTEIALATALTVGAGLLLRSFVAVLGVNQGFDSGHLLTLQITVPPRLVAPAARIAFYDELEAKLKSLPNVTRVGGTTRLPLGSTNVSTFVDVEGRAVTPSEYPEVEFRRAVFDFFGTMGIPLLRGRTFADTDTLTTPRVAVVNAAFASRVFPGEDPIGRRIRTGGSADASWIEIVGVVGSVRHGSLEEAPRPEMYVSYRQGQGPPVNPFLALRMSVDTPALPQAVRSTLREMGVDPPTELRTMNEVRSASVAARRFILLLVSLFGALALALAAVGVYGVVTLAAAERTGEVGIRLALGARPVDIAALVLRQSLTLGLTGTAIGVAIALAISPALATQLFGIGGMDPVTYGGVALLLVLVAAAAAYAPARRAMRVDPAATLRS